MTAPRTALFQRPPADGGIPPEIAAALSGRPSGPPPDDAGQPIQCQACGAMIDPTSGEVVSLPPDAGGDVGGAPPQGGPPPMGA